MTDTPTSAQMIGYEHVPALAPPPGVKPNFMVFNERAELYSIVCSILLGVVYVFLLLRLYAKVWIKRNPGFDDLACVLATVGLSALFGFGVVMESHGVGKHQWDVPLSEIPFILKYGRYVSIVLPPTMLCLKLSLLLLYLRVFAPDKVTRHLIYFGMAICIVAYTILMFLNIFSSINVVIAANKFLGAMNFTSDVYILCVPIAAISKLQLSVKKKIGVMFVFMTGIIACALSAVGLVYRLKVYETEVDATYLLAGTILVTTIEEEVGIMCASMPFFPTVVNNSPLLQKCIHSVHSLGLWTLRTSRHGSTTDGRRSYQKHVSRDGSVEDGLELRSGEASKGAVLPESPKKTPRMELGAFGEDGRPRTSYTEP